ncbi:MAG TPA: hypothetical protein VMM93_12225 [Vicinamibacterales bacterium]|nr:hypothetical protein [Vicinamibacterales bacterium]
MVPRALVVSSFVVFATACGAPAEPPAAQSTAPAAAPAGPVTPPATDEERIASALSAAPASVSSNATILAFDDQMQPRTLREGTNGWTCLPDMPHTPGADPMCLDAAGMAWAQAWMAHETPPADTMGFGYMLAGGSDASNTDPFATAPAEGGRWVDTGPHVMVFNIGDRFPGYPTDASDTTRPYVMFPGTPYAHLMIPVR